MVIRSFIIAVIVLSLLGCGPTKAPSTVSYSATIPPLSMVLHELVKGRAEVTTLLPQGASPHTFEPTPALVASAQRCKALFWVGPGLDGWASKLECPNKIETLALVSQDRKLANPETDDKAPDDPHFWLDPVVVKSLVPELLKKLNEIDPGGKSVYEANASVLVAKLDRLDSVVASLLRKAKGRSLVLIHPSMQYLAARYGLKIAAVVEPSPGKEPTIAYLSRIISQAKASGAKTVFTEPQLPQKEADQVAQSAGLQIGVLDPIGGVEGRETYENLILYNAKELMSKL